MWMRKNKATDAEGAEFLEVASQYGRTRPGQVARYYAALCEILLKDFPDAEKNLTQLNSGTDDNLAGLARFQARRECAAIRKAKSSQAVDLYNQFAEQTLGICSQADGYLLTLAEHYRKTDPAQAAKLYNQVKQEFPDAAEAADQGLDLLNAKS